MYSLSYLLSVLAIIVVALPLMRIPFVLSNGGLTPQSANTVVLLVAAAAVLAMTFYAVLPPFAGRYGLQVSWQSQQALPLYGGGVLLSLALFTLFAWRHGPGRKVAARYGAGPTSAYLA